MNATLFNPLFYISLVFLLQFFVKNQVWKRRIKYFSLLLFVIFSNLWLSTFITHAWEYETIKIEEVTVPYDFGIVLGPFLDEDHYLPIRSESVRFTQAIQLYQQNKFSTFLLSGNDQSILTRQHLIDLCVSAENILLEGKSNNTYQNALLSSQFLKEQDASSDNLLLITSALHMRRAKKCFDKVGLEVTPFSVDYKTSCDEIWRISLNDLIPNFRALEMWERLIYEAVSTVYFKLKNYI